MSTKNYLFVFFCTALSLAFTTQTIDSWKTLALVSFKNTKDKNGHPIEQPVFSETLKKIDNNRIQLTGYILPLSDLGSQSNFVFSQLPYNSCYFCGGAGPETIIEVNMTEAIRFTEDKITLEGTFELNQSDPDHLMYILNQSEQVE